MVRFVIIISAVIPVVNVSVIPLVAVHVLIIGTVTAIRPAQPVVNVSVIPPVVADSVATA